ncbi:MAG TPA: hypothetical protein VF815_32955, partial [Myxococcaceae bacterium]
MPQYWRLTAHDASNYVVVRQEDKALLARYPLVESSSIEPMLDYWLGNQQERTLLRNICAAVSNAVSTPASMKDDWIKRTLIAALKDQRLLASQVPYAVAPLEGLSIIPLKDVPLDVQGEDLQVLIALRVSRGALNRGQAIALIRSGRISDLKDVKNPGTGELQVGIRDSQYLLLTGRDASAPSKPYLPIQIGFICHKDGANIRTLPAEQPGSQCLTTVPLPPSTRVIVLGSASPFPEWAFVAASVGGNILRGYVQRFRITTDLPEPAATLYRVRQNDTLEPIAARIYHQAVRPGRDLRFYENVVLYVNQQAGRSGVRRVNRDVQLVAGECIWLVSVAFANELQGIVPSGSFTGGMLARAREVARHLEDLLESVRRSPEFFKSVAKEYYDAILQNLMEIISVILAFIAAEALSALLAATPTGVGQLAAAAIQVGLASLATEGVVQAGAKALEHATDWLNLAWQANGDAVQIGEASKAFCHMVVNIALAALGAAGLKSNLGRGLKLAQGVKFTPPSLAVMRVAGGGTVAVFNSPIQAVAAASVPINPLTGATAGIVKKAKASPREPQFSKGTSSEQKLTKQPLKDTELEKLLEKLPNWEGIKQFVGRPIPKPNTPEFEALKIKLKEAGYQLEVLTEGKQPFRLKRPPGQALGDEFAALTVTEDGIIVLQNGKTSRISVYSRYRGNYLEWLKQTHGEDAMQAAEIRIASGHQLHHLIPDEIAQSHALIKEALKRIKDYTI